MSTLHWVALATQTKAGGAAIRHLLTRFGSLEPAFEASYQQLTAIRGIGPQTATAILETDLKRAERDLKRFRDDDIRVITLADRGYPSNLLHIPDAPPVLFVQGSIEALHSRAAAIVGTRQPSREGRQFAYRAGVELAARGWVIVSGMALGVDAAAHQGALEANGVTVAILGSGLLKPYPPQNLALADEIAACGAVISELAPDLGVSPRRLIARNRITSGLARAVIIIEAQADSGTLSTARRAIKQGRRVYAIDGAPLDIETRPIPTDWDAFSGELAALKVSAPPPAQPPLF